MGYTLLMLATLSSASTATVKEQVGATVHVTEAPSSWREGTPVVVLWSVLPEGQPSVVAEGRVETLAQGQAVVRLNTDPCTKR